MCCPIPVPRVEPGGLRKVVVKGTSGAGKSTFAAELARRLGLAHIELDALHHGPNWSAPTAEEFRARVRGAMAAAPAGWVVDGNYDAKLGETALAPAEAIVWLDLPLRVKLPRLWRRTLHRIRADVELWGGNRETWRDAFASRHSIFVWTIRSHVEHRRRWPARFGADPRFVRLRSDAEARRWLDEHTDGSPSIGVGASGAPGGFAPGGEAQPAGSGDPVLPNPGDRPLAPTPSPAAAGEGEPMPPQSPECRTSRGTVLSKALREGLAPFRRRNRRG